MDSHPKTAVIADDDAEFRHVLAEYLTAHGFHVAHAANGLEALLAVKRIQPEVLVLDIMMPRLGGIDALRHIRKAFRDTNVFVVTGVADDALRGSAVALGAAALLSKPVELNVLGSIIESVTNLTLDRSCPQPEATGVPDAVASVPRILIVDDEPDIREMLDELLRDHGYMPLLAADGLTALRMIAEEAPDVVLLDIAMPRLTGIDALVAIRARARNAQVIMVSGLGDVDIARRSLSYGASDYVMKPIDFDYLLRSI
jgi:DNA-binding response OmpR family regulator